TGAAILCWAVLGWHSPLGVALVTFAAFVGVLALAEWLRGDANEVDLVAAERADLAPVEPVQESYEPPAAFVDSPPVDDDERPPDVPRKQRKLRGADVVECLVAVFVAAAFAELLRIVFRMQSLVGFAIWWYVAFLLVYFLLVRDRSEHESALDHVVTAVVWSCAAAVTAVLVWMVLFVLFKGLPKLAST